jgi:biopolymer transport protein ExbB
MNTPRFLALTLSLLGALGLPLRTTAQGVESLAAAARTDLRAALDELADLRRQIEAERLPLAQHRTRLEQEVLAARAALERARREEGNQLVLLGVLRTEVNGLSNEVRSLESLLTEYRRSVEARLSVAELNRHRESLRAVAAAEEAPDLAPAEKLARQLDFVGATLERLEALVGGDRFSGQALTPDGVLARGQFLHLGPAAYFTSEDGAVSGVVEQRLNSAEPHVAALTPAQATALREVITRGTGNLPVDPTGGNALRLRATRDPLLVHIAKGGPVMVPILALGGFALAVFLVKWLQIRRVRLAQPQELRAVLAALELGQPAKAERHARAIPGPVGEMLAAAIRHHREPKEYIEEVMYEKMLATRPRLERLVPFLALAAAAAPLLGLLGTVTGMINTFNAITVFGTGDPKTLAGGISEALITTEYGLIVAIPALLLHAGLSRKVKAVLAGMEQTATAFLNGLPEAPNGLAETAQPASNHA